MHYDSDAMAVDAFSHKNPDFLSVFSAGNFGTLQSAYDTTVNSPALAKNAIAAGNARPAGQSYGVPKAAAGLVGQLKFTVGDVEALTEVFVAADFSAAWDDFPDSSEGVPVVIADPMEVRVASSVDACTTTVTYVAWQETVRHSALPFHLCPYAMVFSM